nr:MAG TPA: hypothetical protein [Caudoviricetes sp.]
MDAEGHLSRRGITRLATGHYRTDHYTAGLFELSLPIDAPYADALLIDRLVLIDRAYWGVITGRVVDGGQTNTVSVSGSTLLEWLSRRIIVPDSAVPEDKPMGYDSVSGPTETVMKHYVIRHAINPDNPARRFPALVCMPDQERGDPEDAFMARYANLLATLESIGRRANLGFEIKGDDCNDAFAFEVHPRIDRTVHQTENPPLLLEISRRNIATLVYSQDYKQSGNVFYCSRSGDQYEWETLTQTYFLDGAEEPAGQSRREMALSISVDSDGNQYQELEKNARKEMESYRAAESIVCTMARSLLYGTDYRVGDYATVIDRRTGTMADMELEAVDTVVTESSVDYVATFGKQQLTRLEKLRRDTKAGLYK